MSVKYLIIEDSDKLREGICEFFEINSNGSVSFDQASDGASGLAYIEKNDYDLVIIDIMLPDMSGYDICKKLRAKKNCPVFFLTSLGSESNILKGYEVGADDYIVKPFSVKELYAKAEATVKRYVGKKQEEKILTIGDISLNAFTMQVFAKGKEIELSPKEYFLLKYLMENKGKVFSRTQLLDSVWGMDFDGIDRVVDNQIKKLRKNLGDSGKAIVTVFGRGYKIS